MVGAKCGRYEQTDDKATPFRYMITDGKMIKGFKMCGDITKGWTGLQAQHDFDEESEILGSSQYPFVRAVKIPTDLRAINISVYNETFLAQIEFQGKH